MRFNKFYLNETDNIFKTYEFTDIYLNPTKDEINSIKRNTSFGIKIGVIDLEEIYYWDADIIIHYDIEKDVIHKNFNLSLSWDKNENMIADEEAIKRQTYKNPLYKEIIPKLKELFENDVIIEIEEPNDNNSFKGKYI
jgi:hypothetical protein